MEMNNTMGKEFMVNISSWLKKEKTKFKTTIYPFHFHLY